MNHLSPESKILINPEALFANMQEEVIILGLETDQYYSLNAVGARLWQLLEQDLTLKEIHAALFVEYEVAPEILWEDVIRLIEVMAEENLITIA
jgi:hypothetical protein